MPYAEVIGRKIYYQIHEPNEDLGLPPLALVMGMGGSCRGWLPLQVPEFSKTRRTVIFDNRGCTGETLDFQGFATGLRSEFVFADRFVSK